QRGEQAARLRQRMSRRRSSPGSDRRAQTVPAEAALTRHVQRALDCLLLAPALLPLLYPRGFLYPHMLPKVLAFRSLGILVLAALLFLVFARKELHFERLRQKIAWIPAALLAVAYLTSIAGADFYRSFWSNLERGDGLLTFTVAVLFFYAILLHADARF